MYREMEIKRGMVFYVDLGHENKEGSEQKGTRPCVVVQNDIGNKYSSTVIISLVTSKLNKKKLPTHVMLNEEFLPMNSMIMTEQTVTVDKSRLRDYFGMVNNETQSNIDKAMAISFGLHTREVANNKLTEINTTEKIIIKWIYQGKSLIALEDTIKDLNILIKEYRMYCMKNNMRDEYIERYINIIQQYCVQKAV